VRRRQWATLAAIAVVFVFALYISLPGTPGLPFEVAGRDLSDLRFRQGLDLQGGLHVRFQANPPPEQQLQDGDMEAVKRIIENRVNALGVAEPLIQIEGDNRLIVELPGVEDPEEAIRVFRQTGQLLVINTGFEFIDEGTILPADPSQTVLRGRDLRDARVGFDSLGAPMIEFDLQPDAADRFQTYTASHLNEVLTITVDEVVISSARIEASIRDSGVIRGSFTADEARNVAIQLRYGALPVPLEVVETLSVRPTLGQESLAASLRAGILGAFLVLIFMVAFYRIPGVVAALALVVYASVVFAVFKLIPVTLTLSGLAGFILSVGVAVDANILIFERTREELRSGRAIRGAVESGFNRAWPSIRDSNLSTLIICAVLFGFGSGGVRGFAVTLAIGVAVSMFSAITVSRNLLRLAIAWPALTRPRLFGAGAARSSET
jgi:preprotein translocase subunit SecD